MTIINWEDVAARYEEVQKYKDSTRTNSGYILFACAEVEEKLASRFTVPFSSNNLTAKDLMIDATYLKIFRWKADKEKVERIEKHLESRIKALREGKADMMLDDGSKLLSVGGTVYSTVNDYHPVFYNGPVEDMVVDSSQIENEFNERNL